MMVDPTSELATETYVAYGSMIAENVISLVNDMMVDPTSELATETYVAYGSMIAENVISLVNIVFGLFYNGRIIHIMNEINAIDMAFKKLNIQIEHCKTWLLSIILITYYIISAFTLTEYPVFSEQVIIINLWELCGSLAQSTLNLLNYMVMCQYSLYKLCNVKGRYIIDMVAMIRSSIQFFLLYIVTIEQFFEFFNDHFPIVKLELMTEIGSYMMASIMMIMNSLLGTLFARKVIAILNRIDRIDVDLKRLDVEINYCKTWLWSVMSAIFLTIVISLLPIFASILAVYNQLTFWIFVQIMTEYVMELLNYAVVCQYCVFTIAITARYKAVNAYLKSTLCKSSFRNNVDKMAIARCVVQFLAYYYIALTAYISMIVEDTPDDVLSWVAVIYNTATCTMLIVSSILSTLFTGRIISIMNQIEKIDLEFKQMGLALNHWYDYYIYRGDD
ncbi:hypothetical protein QE152_g22337 [Popillia japonica]|uniref:Gustatory receptor n=1 Tax=Popillia japonica TaxID=7064 RepID=A0AAW1KIZ5_POPJA